MRRLRQHVNPFSQTHLGQTGAPLVLPQGKPVEVELGAGDAEFLLERAQIEPDALYLAIEIRPEWVRRIERLALPHLRAICANLHVAQDIFPPLSVTRFYVNFPDPWFKRRHQPRRWLDAMMVRALADALCPGGEIFVQSDVFEVVLGALATLEAEPRLCNTTGPWRFARQNPYGACSRRERWCNENGLFIWRVRFEKQNR